MKIEFAQELSTIEGVTLMRRRLDHVSNQTVDEPATLRWAAVEALLTVLPDRPISAGDKARRFELALKIQSTSEPIDLSVDELSFIKGLCDSHFPPLVMGQTRRMLEGQAPPIGKK
jgi:hypothetical protein